MKTKTQKINDILFFICIGVMTFISITQFLVGGSKILIIVPVILAAFWIFVGATRKELEL